jgi:hypothetical protein
MQDAGEGDDLRAEIGLYFLQMRGVLRRLLLVRRSSSTQLGDGGGGKAIENHAEKLLLIRAMNAGDVTVTVTVVPYSTGS